MADTINNGVPTPIQVYGRAPNGQLQAVTTDGSGNISITGGTAASVAFSGVTSGTNTTAAMVVGTGGSLASTPQVNIGAVGTTGVLGLVGLTSGTATLTAPAVAGTATNAVVSTNALSAPNHASVEGAAPSGIASSDILFGDSTTHTWSHNSNNNGTNSFTGSWQNTNVTPVTVAANSAAAQNLMAATIPAGTLNRVGRSLKIWLAGVYTLPISAGTTTTIAVKLGSVTLLTITDSSLTTAVTNGQFNINAVASVQTAGASGVVETHGNLTIELGATGVVADSVFADSNTAVSSAVDLTASQTLQIIVTFSVASTSNTATQRQMVLETVG